MKKLLTLSFLALITACTKVTVEPEDNYSSSNVDVQEFAVYKRCPDQSIVYSINNSTGFAIWLTDHWEKLDPNITPDQYC